MFVRSTPRRAGRDGFGGDGHIALRRLGPLCRTALLLSLSAGAAACGSERKAASDLPEWTPEDHQPPPTDPRARGGRETAKSAPVAPSGGTAEAGAALYDVHCVQCHGAGGRGGAMPGAQDLSDPAWQSRQEDAALAMVIRKGRGQMPGYEGRVAPSGIDALVAHLRTLRRAE